VNTLAPHFDWVAANDKRARWWQRGFHSQLVRLLRHHIPSQSSVLSWGCADGTVLKGLRPARGLGFDLSPGMIAKARTDAQGCEFREGDIEKGSPDEKFDAIVASFLTGYLQDIQKSFGNLHASATPDTRLYIASLNTLWLPLLGLGQRLGLVAKQPLSNWLSHTDLINLLELSGWEVVSMSHEQLLPFKIPLLAGFFNRFVVRLPFFRMFGLTILIVARPRRQPQFTGEVSCSVIVPLRNESGNIRPALERIPVLGRGTEVIFVEGHSKDDTWEALNREVAAYNGPLRVSYLQQPGKGKWDAVRAGFERARGDILVIQDGDLTAPPEDLPKFFDAVSSGACEFANGNRLVYPMEKQAMRFLNLLGNKFFALSLSWIIRQPIKDSLCGTKMISRRNYDRLLGRIAVLGDFDPFGDFNLLFGSALLDLRIRDIPVRYKDRTYGSTNIQRFRHGLVLLHMTWFSLWKIRFS
jgi:hypothetical protein